MSNEQQQEQQNNQEQSLVIGLKKEIVKRGYGIRAEEEAKVYAVNALLNSWKTMYSFGITTQLEDMIWNYVDNENAPTEAIISKRCDSSVIGKKSIIADYTNKNGKTHKAHYAHCVNQKCYLGPVSKLGEEPIVFKTNVPIKRKYFTIHIDRLPNVELISELFDPIQPKSKKSKVVIDIDDDDIE